MRKLAAVLALVLLATGCAATPDPAPTVTVTVAPEARSTEGWEDMTQAEVVDLALDRFRDDPREAFIFGSATETVWGTPIGNGEFADEVLYQVFTMCMRVDRGDFTWDQLESSLVDAGTDRDTVERSITLAQVYCPEV